MTETEKALDAHTIVDEYLLGLRPHSSEEILAAIDTLRTFITQSDPQKIRDEVLDEVEEAVKDIGRDDLFNPKSALNRGHGYDVCRAVALGEVVARIRSLRDQEGDDEVLPSEINALPKRVRDYIHDIETRCDPAGDIKTIHSQREQIEGLVARIKELESSAPEKVKGGEAVIRADAFLEWAESWIGHYGEHPDKPTKIEHVIRKFKSCLVHPAPSQPDSEGTREPGVEHGTRDDGIRECVEVLQDERDSLNYDSDGWHMLDKAIGAVYERTALLDKPEPELTWEDVKVRDTFRARHNTGSEHSFFKYHDEGAVRIGYPHQDRKTYPRHLFNGRAWTILSIDQAEENDE